MDEDGLADHLSKEYDAMDSFETKIHACINQCKTPAATELSKEFAELGKLVSVVAGEAHVLELERTSATPKARATGLGQRVLILFG